MDKTPLLDGNLIKQFPDEKFNLTDWNVEPVLGEAIAPLLKKSMESLLEEIFLSLHVTFDLAYENPDMGFLTISRLGDYPNEKDIPDYRIDLRKVVADEVEEDDLTRLNGLHAVLRQLTKLVEGAIE